jgi:hypothetical protein
MSSNLGYVLYYAYIMTTGYLFMDILEFGHHVTNQTDPTSNQNKRQGSYGPQHPNPVPFTTLRLSTPAMSIPFQANKTYGIK